MTSKKTLFHHILRGLSRGGRFILGAVFFNRFGFDLCYDTSVRLRRLSPKTERSNQLDFRSEKNLAVAILRQAWHEAVLDLFSVKETSREDYRLLKRKAIEWISSDEEGFPYWCKLADVDHGAIRKRLQATLKRQRRFKPV